MNIKSVLIVEDEDGAMNYISLILKKLGYRQYVAISGEMALELVKDINLDMAFIDVELGKNMNGVELLRRLRLFPQFDKTPIFAVTGYSGAFQKQEMLSEGFTDYLEKPYTADNLRKMIENHVIKPFSA
ncbi:response regulator [Candidatus Neomarinimicrobiota bacterium]